VSRLLALSLVANTRQGSLNALATMLMNMQPWQSKRNHIDIWLGAWLNVAPSSSKTIANILSRTIEACAQFEPGKNILPTHSKIATWNVGQCFCLPLSLMKERKNDFYFPRIN